MSRARSVESSSNSKAVLEPLRSVTPGVPGAGRFAKGLLVLGVSVLAVTARTTEVVAQDTQLPPLTVESSQAPAKKKAAAKKKASPAPQAAVQPTPEPEAAASATVTEAADVPYTIPAGVSVVGSTEINTVGQARIDDVLRTQPGTFTRESVSNPGIAVNIRGFEGQGRVNMMIDGVRQNFRFTGHEAAGFAYVDPLLLAGIEIQRGTVSTVGGAGALAGTANFRTIDVQDVLKPGANMGAVTSLSWGSNGLGWSEMGAAAARAGGVSIVGALSHHDESDYKNGNGQRVPFTAEDPWSGLVKMHFDIASDERLSFQAMRYNNEFVANSYQQDVTSDIYKASYAINPLDNPLIDFRANVSLSNVEMKYGDYYRSPPPTIEPAMGRVIEDRGIGFDATNTSRFMLGAVGVTSNYGFEYFYDDVDTSNGGVNPTGTSDLASAFSQTKFSYGMWDLITGLRYQHFNLEGQTTLNAGNPFGLPAGNYTIDNSESSWDPKVTLAAQVTPWLQPYITYSQSMRAPTVSETMMTGMHPYAPGFFELEFIPNPFLVPESQKGWEIGFNVLKGGIFTPDDKLRIKADYYNQDVEDYITSCYIPGFPVNRVYFCNAFGTTKLQGVEIEGDYDVRYAFVRGSYTYTDSKLPGAENSLGAASYLPDHIVSVTGGLRFLDEKLELGLRGTYVSQTDLRDGTYEESYTLADFFSTYQVHEDLTVGLTVTNLFDRAYTPALSTVPSGNPAIETGRGRTFILSTRARF